jgi:class 3 adenylate cyclase
VLICADCGFENPEGHRFCGSCGASLTPAVERRKLVTSVFCDLSGSTALGERVDAESVFDLMRSYYETARGALQRHGGAVEKFIGDAVVGMFGVPEANEDDALRARRAALEIQAQFTGGEIAVRIGINTGEVVAGDAARREMFASGDAVVLGDAVNVAARLEQAAAPGEILLGEAAYRLVKDAVTVEPIEPIKAKGKAEPLSAYRLLAVKAEGRSQRSSVSTMVGRESELAFLRTGVEAAATGGCCLLTLVGEPGVGKSRLVAEALAGLREEIRVTTGSCLAYGEGISFWAIAQIVRDLAGIRDDQSAETARARLPGQLAQLLGLSDGTATADQIAWSVAEFLAAAAGERPLVVVIDDLQWAEPALLDLVADLPGLIGDAHVLLVCLARPELLESRPEWPVRVRLDPLGPEEVDALLESLRAPAATRVRIAQAAAGNPLYAEELVAWVEEGGDPQEMPTSLSALLGARLDRLQGNERDALERGAIEGELFHQASVVELTDQSARRAVPGGFDQLSRKDLIRLTAASVAGELIAYRFKHILVRDAAYRATTKKLRAVLHERFADWLAGTAGERLGEYEEIVGYHLEQAYRYRAELGSIDAETRALGERAAAHLAAAARRAQSRNDSHAEAGLLERALAIGIADPRERLSLEIDLGTAFGATRRVKEADALLVRARNLATSRGERGLAARAAVQQIWQRTGDPTLDWAEAEAVAGRAVATLTELGDDRGLAVAVRLHGISLAFQHGHTLEAGAELERAIAHARACADADYLRAAIVTFACNYLVGGPTPAALAAARCGELIDSVRDNPLLTATIKRPLALFLAMQGSREQALALLEEARLLLDERRQTRMNELYREVVARGRYLAGDIEGAKRELEQKWSYFRDLQVDTVDTRAVNAGIDLAWIAVDEDRLEDAEAFLSYSRDGGAHEWKRLAVLARLAVRAGRTSEALDLAARARTLTEARTGELDRRARLWEASADVFHLAGSPGEADTARATALSLYEAKGNIVSASRLRALATA